MQTTDELTLLDAWPLFALGALAIFAVIVVFRGLRKPPDDSDNSASGGGAGFPGKNARW
jgi:hypothetical protein